MSAMAFLTRALVFCQAWVPSLLSCGSGAGVGAAVLLDEVEAGERDVEFGLIGELEDHKLERRGWPFSSMTRRPQYWAMPCSTWTT